MPQGEPRYYIVQVSRLMCGGRLFHRGDVLGVKTAGGPFYHLLRSGAVRSLPQGIVADLAMGEPIELDEFPPSPVPPH